MSETFKKPTSEQPENLEEMIPVAVEKLLNTLEEATQKLLEEPEKISAIAEMILSSIADLLANINKNGAEFYKVMDRLEILKDCALQRVQELKGDQTIANQAEELLVIIKKCLLPELGQQHHRNAETIIQDLASTLSSFMVPGVTFLDLGLKIIDTISTELDKVTQTSEQDVIGTAAKYVGEAVSDILSSFEDLLPSEINAADEDTESFYEAVHESSYGNDALANDDDSYQDFPNI